MDETSGEPVGLDEVVGHLQALFQHARKGPPRWVQHELTFGQLRLLFVLAESGPVSIGQLADMLGVSDATASEIVDRLERRGFADRSHRADDRRVVECRLSDGGSRLLAEVTGARRERFRALLSVLTTSERTQLNHLISIMAERIAATAQSTESAEGDSQLMAGTTQVLPTKDAGGAA
jgi:DNA-binding MarR family transcriptional regulator